MDSIGICLKLIKSMRLGELISNIHRRLIVRKYRTSG